MSVVKLFLHETEFLLAVSVSQRVFALPGSQPPGAGYIVGAVVQGLGAVAPGAFKVVSFLLHRPLSGWAVRIPRLRLHIHSVHG